MASILSLAVITTETQKHPLLMGFGSKNLIKPGRNRKAVDAIRSNPNNIIK